MTHYEFNPDDPLRHKEATVASMRLSEAMQVYLSRYGEHDQLALASPLSVGMDNSLTRRVEPGLTPVTATISRAQNINLPQLTIAIDNKNDKEVRRLAERHEGDGFYTIESVIHTRSAYGTHPRVTDIDLAHPITTKEGDDCIRILTHLLPSHLPLRSAEEKHAHQSLTGRILEYLGITSDGN